MHKVDLVRWWSSVFLASTAGALLAATVADSGTENPFAISFVPWARNEPGIASEVPVGPNDFINSIIFGAIVGAAFGVVYWLVYTKVLRPNDSQERTGER